MHYQEKASCEEDRILDGTGKCNHPTQGPTKVQGSGLPYDLLYYWTLHD
jgi:hypothetical protein